MRDYMPSQSQVQPPGLETLGEWNLEQQEPFAMTSDAESFYASRPWLKNYAHGVAREIGPLWQENLPDLVRQAVNTYKDKPAFTVCLHNGMTSSLSYQEVDDYSNHFASYLRHGLKLEKGARVALQMPNGLAFPICAFGILKAGCILVNVNPLYTASEMEHQFIDCSVDALVIVDMFCDKLPEVLPKVHIRHIIRCSVADFFAPWRKLLIKSFLRFSGQVKPTKLNCTELSDVMKRGKELFQSHNFRELGTWKKGSKAAEDQVHLAPDDIALLQYTGGTTGVSKGAILSHRNIVVNIQQVLQLCGNALDKENEICLTTLPMYHIFAFTVNCFMFFACGTHNILIPNPKPVSNVRKAFEKYRITWTTGVSTLFNAYLHEKWFIENPPRHLKVSIAGGTALQGSVQRAWEELLKTPIYVGFGLTEASPIVSVDAIGGHVESQTVGVPLPGTDIRIVDESGSCVPPGTPGELLVRGPQVMSAYWRKPEETATIFRDGWLCTGDIAVMDHDGLLKIVDRKKDMILVSGFNVYPNEVEECIASHPDVKEVAVISVPDETTGEAPRAYVVSKRPDLTEKEIRKYCRTQITAYKVPRSVEFREVLPKSNVGKVLRKELRREYLELHGQKPQESVVQRS